MSYSNLLIMLDCTKTSRGLFFGLIVFAGTLFSYILFVIYEPTPSISALITEITEIILLLIASILTIIAYFKIVKNYSKVIPETNMFDVALEILSLCGVYAYSINSLIGIFSSFSPDTNESKVSIQQFIDNKNITRIIRSNSQSTGVAVINVTDIIARLLSLLQSTFQTLFILECLRRYAYNTKPFMRKPVRALKASFYLFF